MLTIFQAESPAQIVLARELMLEYARRLEFNLCFQGFEEELRKLPGEYGPPRGRLLLAFSDNDAAGLCGLRPLKDAAACEMKRLRPPRFSGPLRRPGACVKTDCGSICDWLQIYATGYDPRANGPCYCPVPRVWIQRNAALLWHSAQADYFYGIGIAAGLIGISVGNGQKRAAFANRLSATFIFLFRLNAYGDSTLVNI